LQHVGYNDIKINEHVKAKRGGTSTVYQVDWKGKQYAMKRPNFVDCMTERQEKLFLRELESQASLRHPNCVGVFAVCLEQNHVFIMMEWMHGGSLWERLQQTQEKRLAAQQGSAASASGALVLSDRMRVAIARDVCDGLQYMHSKGLVHGDIKSLNILLDKDNSAKLCDFGCSVVRNFTTSGTILARSISAGGGTPAWAAPEILCEGKQHTFQTDIYALGIVMWELLTCKQPHESLSKDQIYGKLKSNDRPPIPDSIPTDFPQEFVVMMKRCWDEDPELRPSAAEVHQCMVDITSALPNEPVKLFPRNHEVSDRTSILPCLMRALPASCCAPALQAIVAAAETYCKTPHIQSQIQAYNLEAIEAHSIFVYTASQGSFLCPTHMAPFSSYNTALRSARYDSDGVWCDYSYVLHSALLKLPSVACTVYRGLNVPLSDLSHMYWRGGFVWLRSPTSTTTDKDKTMRQFGQGAGASAGTFMELRVKNAKNIEALSAVPGEQERLIPHNTCFRVLQVSSAADVRLLGAFGTLPPHVDLVVVEEVCATVFSA
jgi:serine/threonine protein kinase